MYHHVYRKVETEKKLQKHLPILVIDEMSRFTFPVQSLKYIFTNKKTLGKYF